MKRILLTLLAAVGLTTGLAAPAQAINNSVVPHGDHRANSVAQLYTPDGAAFAPVHSSTPTGS